MDLRERTRQAGGRAGSSAVDTAFFVALLWVVEIIDVITRHAVDRFASLRAWEFTDLPSIFTFSFAHYGWAHLIGNTALLLPFGFLLGLSGRRVAVQVTLVVMVCSGLAAWALTPPHSATAGASGVVFGWLTYLIVRGAWSKRWTEVALGLALLAVFGYVLWGVLPRHRACRGRGTSAARPAGCCLPGSSTTSARVVDSEQTPKGRSGSCRVLRGRLTA